MSFMKRLWEATKTEYRGNKNFRRKMNSKFIGYPMVLLGFWGLFEFKNSREIALTFGFICAVGIGIVIWGMSIEMNEND